MFHHGIENRYNKMFIVYCQSRKRIMFLNEAMKSSYIQVNVLFIRYIFRAAVHRNLPEGGPENNHAGCAPAGGEYSTVQYSTVQYSTVQYSTVLYSTEKFEFKLAFMGSKVYS